MTYRGAELHLLGGSLVISTQDVTFSPELGYGVNEAFFKVFTLSYLKFLCDSPLKTLGEKPRRTVMSFFGLLTRSDIRQTIKEYSSFADTILREEYSAGSDSSQRVFHEFMIDTPIFKEYHEWTRTGRPDLLKYVLSFLRFGKKLNCIDEDLDATAFREWTKVEEKLRTLVLPTNITTTLASVIRALLPPLIPDQLLPRFGPGNVSESGVTNVYAKLRTLGLDRRLAYAFTSPLRDDDKGFGANVGTIAQGDSSDIPARLKFVPKDISKSRSICMEPNSYMYFQQEVLRWMRNAMKAGLISRFVNLDDQSPNRRAATHGSLYQSSDTIDLSSASDSVSVELVRRVFPKDWLFYMLATRTSKVRVPSGEIVAMKKFAPMGSAICFPTQCIIFTAALILSAIAVDRGELPDTLTPDEASSFIRRRFHRTRNVSTPFTGRYEPPVVFGDDLICDSRITDQAVALLSQLGFSVNVSKSFTGSMSFRESCGIYSYEGLDVTPFLFRLPFFKEGSWDAKVFASLIENVNNAKLNGYHSVATLWLSLLEGYGFKYPLPFTDDPLGFGIHTTNKRSVTERNLRYNADWQTYEELQQGIGPRRIREIEPSNLESYRYNQWWRSRISGSSTSLSERSLLIRPQETRLVPRWTRYEK
jgi:hypothetical protein